MGEVRYQPKKRPGIGRARIMLYAFLGPLAAFALLPFTQALSNLGQDRVELYSFDIAPPPPPPPPDIEEPPEEEVEQEPPPEMQQPPPPLSLSQLELALNPGIGDAMAATLGFGGFSVQPDALEEMQLFDVKDLDELPRPINRVPIETPPRFRQERISGLVRLEVMIDENGRTTVLSIVESSHSELEEPAREAAQKWTWTPPKKNGEPVRARYYFPLGFTF